MWHQALRKTPELLSSTDYGWEHSDINKVQRRLDFYTKGCKCSKGDTLCNHQKGCCGCARNHRQCGPACKCSKEKCYNKSEPFGKTLLQMVPPHCAHISEETHFKRHTPEEMYSESEKRKMQTVRMKIKASVWPWKLTTQKLTIL